MCKKKLWCCLQEELDPKPLCQFKSTKISCLCCIHAINIVNSPQGNHAEDRTDGANKSCLRFSRFLNMFRRK